jgi:hypothetical protein
MNVIGCSKSDDYLEIMKSNAQELEEIARRLEKFGAYTRFDQAVKVGLSEAGQVVAAHRELVHRLQQLWQIFSDIADTWENRIIIAEKQGIPADAIDQARKRRDFFRKLHKSADNGLKGELRLSSELWAKLRQLELDEEPLDLDA